MRKRSVLCLLLLVAGAAAVFLLPVRRHARSAVRAHLAASKTSTARRPRPLPRWNQQIERHWAGADNRADETEADNAITAEPTKARAATQALTAIAADLQETDAERRTKLIAAALSTWASTDVEAAGAWALAPTAVSRDVALAAVIRGAAATDPIGTVRLVTRISIDHPADAGELGHDLIFSLSKGGHFSTAATWAVSGEQTNVDWITDAYNRWAAAQPEPALLSATAIAKPAARRAAVIAAIEAWGLSEPGSLLECAERFPDGPEKKLAITTALQAWRHADPHAAAAWAESHSGLSAAATPLQ